MNKTTEALKLAKESLECLPEMCGVEEALAAIREALAEPVKQETVAWPVDRNWFYSVLRYAENNPDCFEEVAPDCVSLDSCDADTVVDALNAAPVDAKAIRAEALEEAAKLCRTAQAKGLQSIREAIEAAIRKLKDAT